MSARTPATLTTFTLLRFDNRQRWWMWLQMALARPQLARTPGLRFWKLLGAGKDGGFSLQPDFNRFGLLLVWEQARSAQDFFNASTLFHALRQRAAERWTAFLLPIQARGAWNRRQPFVPASSHEWAHVAPIAVLTRATIRLAHLRDFWAHVPSANVALTQTEGVLFSIGVGEMPLARQATFSVWRDIEAIHRYAHRTRGHAEALRRTRREHWYAEELFARFAVLATEGSWCGQDPLGGSLAANPPLSSSQSRRPPQWLDR